VKKRLYSCADCGDDNSILTQVSSGPEVILLCSDCYDTKYLNVVLKEVNHVKGEKIKIKKR